MKEPIFEVRYKDKPEKQAFCIWEDGRISGFPENVVVINRIKPKIDMMIAYERMTIKRRSNEIQSR